jgi:nucleotide-binding universal stress UspA family protein
MVWAAVAVATGAAPAGSGNVPALRPADQRNEVAVTDEPRTILLCYDGSPQSEHAVGVAATLFPGARARVLNVWEPIERIIARYAVLAPFMGEEVGAADVDAESTARATVVKAVEAATAAGLDASAHTAELRSTVWEAVLAAAEELQVDVIVTGTRSLHGLREAVANSLSHALLQHSARPVLAIPTPVEAEAAG